MSIFYSNQEGLMSSTSVHLPLELVLSLDALAARRKISRNRLIAEACERLIRQDAGEWPEAFFANDDLSAADLRELRAAGSALEIAVRRRRRNRRRSPFA
jgi:predicted DNA-binding protein